MDGATLRITIRAFMILMEQTIYLAVKCSIYIVAIGVLNGETVENSVDQLCLQRGGSGLWSIVLLMD